MTAPGTLAHEKGTTTLPSPSGFERLRDLLARALDAGERERALLLSEVAAEDPELAQDLAALLRADGAPSVLDASWQGLVAELGGELAEGAERKPCEGSAGAEDGRAQSRPKRWRHVVALAAVLSCGAFVALLGVRRNAAERERSWLARLAEVEAVGRATDPGGESRRAPSLDAAGAIELGERLLAERPGDLRAMEAVAAAASAAAAGIANSESSGRRELTVRAVELRRRVVTARPADVEASAALAESLRDLGAASGQGGDRVSAIAAFDEASAIEVRRVDAKPGDLATRLRLAESLLRLGAELQAVRREEDALAPLARAAELVAAATSTDPQQLRLRMRVAAERSLAELALGQFETALASQELAVASMRALRSLPEGAAEPRDEAMAALRDLGDLHRQQAELPGTSPEERRRHRLAARDAYREATAVASGGIVRDAPAGAGEAERVLSRSLAERIDELERELAGRTE